MTAMPSTLLPSLVMGSGARRGSSYTVLRRSGRLPPSSSQPEARDDKVDSGTLLEPVTLPSGSIQGLEHLGGSTWNSLCAR
jgi:hypothetical protein